MEIFWGVMMIICTCLVLVNMVGLARATVPSGAVWSLVGMVFGALGLAIAVVNII